MIKVGETTLLTDQTPLMLCDGELCLNTNSGRLSSLTLSTHMNSPTIDLKDQLKTFIKLRKFSDAGEICRATNTNENWKTLGEAAIADLDIPYGK